MRNNFIIPIFFQNGSFPIYYMHNWLVQRSVSVSCTSIVDHAMGDQVDSGIDVHLTGGQVDLML